MKIIGIVGCDGRENAIGKSLLRSLEKIQVFYIGSHSNIGLDNLGANYKNGDILNASVILDWVKTNNIEFVIIGPEKPLEVGIVDVLEENGIECFGPRKILASLETSKLFCRNFLAMLEKKYNLQLNPEYFEFTSQNQLTIFTEKYVKPFVIKQDELAGGKGVQVMGDHFKTSKDGHNICMNLYENNIPFIIEEKLIGSEFSLFSITDGINISHCPPVQDYKRVYENNTGPNTGGMGAIMNYLPFLNEEDIKQAENINKLVIENISNYTDTYKKYKGVLYGSFIKTNDGIRVIEYNCRFGDPEVIPLFESMKTNFYDICKNISKQTLPKIDFSNDIFLSKYIVPEGYPIKPLKNYEFYIHKIDNSIYNSIENSIIWASCEKKGDHYLQLGSRTFAYTLSGSNIKDIQKNINEQLDKVQGRVFYRKDIGSFNIGSFNIDKYSEAGVNIDLGNKIVKEIQPLIRNTENNSVLSTSGGFNGMIEFNDKILVSSMDGVGTKSIFVKNVMGEKGLENLGQDLVNHCINDILVSGAQPLFFLDYFASSTLSCEEVVYFVKGVSKACANSGVILAGGETAEMPDVYKDEHCDLVGTIVGSLDKTQIIDGKNDIKAGNIVLGLKSNGLHTNGYSLIRKLMKIAETQNKMPSEKVIEKLCNPHKCYLEEVNILLKKIKINGLCHITGGGFVDNPPRILPEGLKLELDYSKLFKDEIYDWIKSLDYVTKEEMMKVFNCGYGMLIIISLEELDKLEKGKYDILGKVI
jgi:phosphoribosylamine--glycine ligase/phosphoribosylaminoimidazole synthetase